jgi:hypothetical protein
MESRQNLLSIGQGGFIFIAVSKARGGPDKHTNPKHAYAQ